MLGPTIRRCVFVYLDLLRREDLPCAVAEAEIIAESPDVPAIVLVCLHQHPRDSGGAGGR